MSQALQLTEYEQQLCRGSYGYFFLACVKHFGFLASDHDFVMEFTERERGGFGVSFIHDVQTEYFAVRVYGDFESLPWCEIHRFAGLDYQTRMRLQDACERFGFSFPSEERHTGTLLQLGTQYRIQEFAECVRAHLDAFRKIPIPQRT